jgi:hypothetical protein
MKGFIKSLPLLAQVLMIFILLHHQDAFACKCRQDAIEAMRSDPNQARLIFIGKTVEDNSVLKMKVEKKWRVSKDEYPLDTQTSCRVFFKSGEEFLVLSSSAEGLHSCSTLFVPKTEAESFIKKINQSPL